MQSRKRRGGGRSFLWAAHYWAALATYPEVVTHRASTSPPVLLFHARCMDRENRQSPPLFGLAPCGVFPATAITGGAVRSYRTFSPLPRPTLPARAIALVGKVGRGGMFSVALSVNAA